MSKFELSIQTPEGTEYKDWETVQRDILQELLSAHLIEGIDEDCGRRLGDILTDADIISVAINMSEYASFFPLTSIITKDYGFYSFDTVTAFLKKLMLIGNGECPFCGASSYQEIDASVDWEYDQDDHNRDGYRSPAKRICHNCQYEWSVEE
jgi:hypothetical protein